MRGCQPKAARSELSKDVAAGQGQLLARGVARRPNELETELASSHELPAVMAAPRTRLHALATVRAIEDCEEVRRRHKPQRYPHREADNGRERLPRSNSGDDCGRDKRNDLCGQHEPEPGRVLKHAPPGFALALSAS